LGFFALTKFGNSTDVGSRVCARRLALRGCALVEVVKTVQTTSIAIISEATRFFFNISHFSSGGSGQAFGARALASSTNPRRTIAPEALEIVSGGAIVGRAKYLTYRAAKR
jgi:hypothetical protein